MVETSSGRLQTVSNGSPSLASVSVKKRLIIASDGSLLHDAGTFGWKLTTQNCKQLFHGFGPVDGPIVIWSLTWRELGRFTAPLLLITVLARHWRLRHLCNFWWNADSKVVIERVSLVTKLDHNPTKQPENSDLSQDLRRSLHPQWIKSHQDSKVAYDQLSPDA